MLAYVTSQFIGEGPAAISVLGRQTRHRPGHSLGKNIKLHEMKNEKNYMGFLIHKI